jgi:hypothetical protein
MTRLLKSLRSDGVIPLLGGTQSPQFGVEWLSKDDLCRAAEPYIGGMR